MSGISGLGGCVILITSTPCGIGVGVGYAHASGVGVGFSKLCVQSFNTDGIFKLKETAVYPEFLNMFLRVGYLNLLLQLPTRYHYLL